MRNKISSFPISGMGKAYRGMLTPSDEEVPVIQKNWKPPKCMCQRPFVTVFHTCSERPKQQHAKIYTYIYIYVYLQMHLSTLTFDGCRAFVRASRMESVKKGASPTMTMAWISSMLKARARDDHCASDRRGARSSRFFCRVDTKTTRRRGGGSWRFGIFRVFGDLNNQGISRVVTAPLALHLGGPREFRITCESILATFRKLGLLTEGINHSSSRLLS